MKTTSREEFENRTYLVPGEDCKNEWCEPVSDEEYGKLK